MREISKFTQLNLFVSESNELSNLRIQHSVPIESAMEVVSPLSDGIQADRPPALHGDAANGPDAVPDCEWSEFMRVNGRIPVFTDARKPWEYRGWLLYYRLLCESHPEVTPRWEYWARTRIAGKLLDEPIPILQFENCASRECYRIIEGWLRTIDRLQSHWSPMDTLLDWLLWGFGLRGDAPKISHELNAELYRSVNLGPLLLKPYDYLGEWIANQKGGWNPHAFFPTPHSVVEMMMQMTLATATSPAAGNAPGRDTRSLRIMEPCLGSGRMLLHASNYSLRLYGVDIDPMMVKTSLVNGALYAPWMVRPFPESYFSEPVLSATAPDLAVEVPAFN